MGTQPIALRPLIGMDGMRRRMLRAKVKEISRWLDQSGIPDRTLLEALIAERGVQMSEGEESR